MKNMLTSFLKLIKFWAFVPLPLLLFTCSDEPGGGGATTSTNGGQNEIVGAAGATVADQFFSQAEMTALYTIKNRFEEGLRVGFEKRTVGYAYLQNATRMRLDVLENSPVANNYPFDGRFNLTMVAEAVEKLPFVGSKCGFAKEETNEVVNYYCLTLDENYFNYLAAIPNPSGLIKSFATAYQKEKSVSPAMRQRMVLESIESLDLDDWDHQLFYLMFQCWANEEIIAYQKVNALPEPATGEVSPLGGGN